MEDQISAYIELVKLVCSLRTGTHEHEMALNSLMKAWELLPEEYKAEAIEKELDYMRFRDILLEG